MPVPPKCHTVEKVIILLFICTFDVLLYIVHVRRGVLLFCILAVFMYLCNFATVYCFNLAFVLEDFYKCIHMQVGLASRLSETSTLLAESQLEVTSLKNRESELRQQVNKLVAMDMQSRDELSSLKLKLTGELTATDCIEPACQNA